MGKASNKIGHLPRPFGGEFILLHTFIQLNQYVTIGRGSICRTLTNPKRHNPFKINGYTKLHSYTPSPISRGKVGVKGRTW